MYSLFVHVFLARLEEHLAAHRMKHPCHSVAAHVVNAHCTANGQDSLL